MLIVAASARPWIRSAEIAGFDVIAFDFFSDWDSILRGPECVRSFRGGAEVGERRAVGRLKRFEDLLLKSNLELISSCDYAIFAGGLENHPSIIAELASRVSILGPNSSQHARLGDTVEILASLKKMRHQVPVTSYQLTEGNNPSAWLKKSFRSSSGLGIVRATAADVGSESSRHYYQSEVSGESFSAVFVSSAKETETGRTAFVGWTRQLVNEPWCGAGEFRYCGSIGLLPIPEVLRPKIESIGQTIADQYGVVGAWGIDFLVDGTNVWPVDFNIRLTASMEIFDGMQRGSKGPYRSIVDLHVRACLGELNMQRLRQSVNKQSADWAVTQKETCFGKSIVFYDGTSAVRVTDEFHRNLVSQWRLIGELNTGQTGLADIPREGEWIEPGQPICTILAKESPQQVGDMLKTSANEIRRAVLRLEAAQ